MKLAELTEGLMKERVIKAQEKAMSLFGFGESEAEQVVEFATKQRDWEDLGQDSRERLYSHYQKTMPYGTAKAKTGDPYVFILRALKTDLGL